MNTNLKAQIESDLDKLQKMLTSPQGFNVNPKILQDMLDLVANNPNSFVTIANKTLKIRDGQDNRLMKIVPDFAGLPHDILDHLEKPRHKDAAYLFLLALKLNNQFDIVKTRYRNCNPKAKENLYISKLKLRLKELTTDFLDVTLGGKVFRIDDVITIPNTPKADLALSFQGKPVIFISHKYGVIENSARGFRQYSGVSKYSLGNMVTHAEIDKFKDDLSSTFSEAQITGMKCLRKGSYFAKKIDDVELGMTAIFGRDYISCTASIHNVHVLLQGEMQLNKTTEGFELIGSHHTMLNPKLFKVINQVDQNYLPHFVVTKSLKSNQFHAGTRLGIWPLNYTVRKGLDNYEKFFVKKDYQSFKNEVSKIIS